MSGVVSLLLGLVLRLKRRINPQKILTEIPDWVFISIGLLCLFVAGFQAWNDKNTALISLQERLKSPELIGELSALMDGSFNGVPIIVVGGTIRNPLGPPSGVVGWKMNLEFPDGRKISGESMLLTGKDYVVPLTRFKGKTITLKNNKYWPAVCEQPIPAGGSESGWFLSTFNGLNLEEARINNALVVLEVHDAVANKTFKFKIPMVYENNNQLPPGNMP